MLTCLWCFPTVTLPFLCWMLRGNFRLPTHLPCMKAQQAFIPSDISSPHVGKQWSQKVLEKRLTWRDYVRLGVFLCLWRNSNEDIMLFFKKRALCANAPSLLTWRLIANSIWHDKLLGETDSLRKKQKDKSHSFVEEKTAGEWIMKLAARLWVWVQTEWVIN